MPYVFFISEVLNLTLFSLRMGEIYNESVKVLHESAKIVQVGVLIRGGRTEWSVCRRIEWSCIEIELGQVSRELNGCSEQDIPCFAKAPVQQFLKSAYQNSPDIAEAVEKSAHCGTHGKSPSQYDSAVCAKQLVDETVRRNLADSRIESSDKKRNRLSICRTPIEISSRF